IVRPMADLFYSSRRRHTRWPRNWSSDVCSSDLESSANAAEPIPDQDNRRGLRGQQQLQPGLGRGVEQSSDGTLLEWEHAQHSKRSEERRVGKEGRTRRRGEAMKQKDTCERC